MRDFVIGCLNETIIFSVLTVISRGCAFSERSSCEYVPDGGLVESCRFDI
jgi:hypothetical protein